MAFPSSPTDEAFARLLTDSYQRVLGRPLLPGTGAEADTARWLYEDAPFVLLAHDTSADPLFVYANRTAQRRFGYPWDEFVGMPSRLSAQAPERAERDAFMAAVLRNGFVDDYRGLRITRSGSRFWIEQATVWNLVDAANTLLGQAALVPRWIDD
jgi:PAS domain S-box-containing protein